EPWIEVFEEHIRLPDGRLVDDFYSIRLPDFVVIAPVTEDGRLVLVRHYRHGPRRVTHSLPSGFIEGAESPGEAAKRELLEETGYAAGEWSALGSFVVDGNRRCGLEHVFLATGARRVSEPSSADLAESTAENIQGHLDSGVVELMKADLLAPGATDRACEGMDYVFHLAAIHGGRGYVEMHDAECGRNLVIDGLMVKSAIDAGVDKFVFASSGCVYPNYIQQDISKELYLTEDMVGPPYDSDHLYGWAKLMGEL